MRVRVGVDEELLGVGPRLDKGAFHVDPILILAWQWRKGISEGGDVMLNVIHVSEVQSSDPLPKHGVGPDDVGGAVGLVHLRVGRNGCLGIGVVLAEHEGADAFFGA